jgi:phosphatidylglycerophosphate synthase
MNSRLQIPWWLVGCRAALAPALMITARLAHPEAWLGAMVVAGFLSDVYDGILARRWGIASPALRLADSAVDTFFYLGVLSAIVERHWPVLRARLGLLIILLALEFLCVLFDWVKFHRLASYHSYASKLWGVLLATASFMLLCFDCAFWLVTAALVWGIACNLEGLAMSVLLPEWRHDVKTIPLALALRREIIASREAQIL